MKVLLLTIMALSILSLISVSLVNAQNITDTDRKDNDNDDNDACFGSDADFCGGADYIPNENKDNDDNDKDDDKGIYACNVITDSDEFCKENLEKNIQKEKEQNNNNNNKQSSDTGKITVGYGDVGSYYGKGKVVIKNLDTGETLVTKKLNFAKQHHNQGDDCCVKVYTFDKDGTHKGDDIFVKVTGGGGSWETGPYDYKKNLRISVSLEEIGEDVDGNYIK